MGEYLSSNALIAYPFREDTQGFHRVGLRIPPDLIVDAAFEGTGSTMWYLDRIQRISASQLDLIVAQNGVFPCRCSATLAVDPVLGTLSPYILAFDPEPLPPLPPRTARLILSREALTSYLGTLTDGQRVQFGTSLPFESSTVDYDSRGVHSIALWNNGPPNTMRTIEPVPTGRQNYQLYDAVFGDVTINCGYNLSLDQVGPTEGDQTSLTLHAVPGAGAGKAPCVDEPTFTRGIPGVIPLQGTVTIKGGQDGCYAVVPIPSLGTIQLQGHCQACCSCDDYVAYLNYLHGLCDRIRTLHDDLDTLRDDAYEPAVKRYNTVVAPPYLTPTMWIYGFRGSNYGIHGSSSERVGSPNWFRAVITIVNNSNNPISISALGATAAPGHAVSASYTIDGLAASYGKALEVDSLAEGLPIIPAGCRVVVTVLFNVELQTWLIWGQWDLTVYGAAVDTETGEVTPLAKTFTTT